MKTMILITLNRILNKHLLIHTQKLSLRANLFIDPDMTRYEFMEMLLHVENNFPICIESIEEARISTVRDLVYCIETKLRRDIS